MQCLHSSLYQFFKVVFRLLLIRITIAIYRAKGEAEIFDPNINEKQL